MLLVDLRDDLPQRLLEPGMLHSGKVAKGQLAKIYNAGYAIPGRFHAHVSTIRSKPVASNGLDGALRQTLRLSR